MMRRMRRLRKPGLRRIVAETRVSTDDLIMPLFVDERLKAPVAIGSMPGQNRHSIESLAKEVEELEELGVPAVILFGLPEKKDEVGSGAWDLAGVVQKAAERIKETTSKVVVIADLCLCEYTSHGHCGLIKNQLVSNDETLPLLGKAEIGRASCRERVYPRV